MVKKWIHRMLWRRQCQLTTLEIQRRADDRVYLTIIHKCDNLPIAQVCYSSGTARNVALRILEEAGGR